MNISLSTIPLLSIIFVSFKSLIFIQFLNETAKRKILTISNIIWGNMIFVLISCISSVLLHNVESWIFFSLFFILCLIYASIYYENDIREILILTIIYNISFTFISFIGDIFESYVQVSQPNAELVINIFNAFLLYVLITMVIPRFIDYKEYSIMETEFRLLMLFGMPCIIGIIFYVDGLFQISGVICNLAIIALSYEFKMRRKSEEETQLLRERNELLEKQDKLLRKVEDAKYKSYQDHREVQERMSRINHDLNHHFNYILSCEDIKEIKDYIYKLRGQVWEIAKFYNTGNALIDIILQEQHEKAMKAGVEFSVVGGFDEDYGLQIDPGEASVIFGNLLNNAVEATSKLGEKDLKKINVNFYQERQKEFVLEINNTVDASKVKIDEEGNMKTTKEDKTMHGLGLESVRQSVKRLGGSIDMELSEYSFTVRVVIPLKK